MPIARVDKIRAIQPLYTTPDDLSASAPVEVVTSGPLDSVRLHSDRFSRTSSGTSAATLDVSGPQTPSQLSTDTAMRLDLESAVEFLNGYDASSSEALGLPSQPLTRVGPPSTSGKPGGMKYTSQTVPLTRSPIQRLFSNTSHGNTPVTSPLEQHVLIERIQDPVHRRTDAEAGPSTPPANIETSVSKQRQDQNMRLLSNQQISLSGNEPLSSATNAILRPIVKRARSRHSSKAGAEHGFGGARLGNLNFSSLSLSSMASSTDVAHRHQDFPRIGLDGDTVVNGEVIMTPTTEEYRYFAHHEPNVEDDEGEDVVPRGGFDSFDRRRFDAESTMDAFAEFRISSDQHFRRPSNSSTRTDPILRRKASVRSLDDGSDIEDQNTGSGIALDDSNDSTVLPSPSRSSFKTRGSLQVIASSNSDQMPAFSSPHASPISRAPSPASLVRAGPVDPRAYSARSRYRSIADFCIEDEDAGQGAYGLVKQARMRGQDGRGVGPKLIIKYIIKERILADCWKKHKVLGPLPVEIHVLDHLRRIPTQTFLPNAALPLELTGHPNICGMLDFFEDAEHYYMIMPRFGEGEDLFDFVEAAPEGLPVSVMLDVFGQIADAIAFLHSVGIVHRDIKDENVILDGNGRVQLIDFGSAAYVHAGRKFDTFSGTLDFAAPEVLRGERYEGRETDVWALGVLGYVLLCGECPFWNSEEVMIALAPGTRARQALESKRQMASEAVDLLLACLSIDASHRPSARQICRHAAFLTDGWQGHLGWQRASCLRTQ